ncbi:MAG: hypothetical protein WBO04_15745 [Steroidobacteraceae bacterium]
MVFDEVFSEQVFERGKIEEGRVMQRFFRRTGQSLTQEWLVELVKRMLRHLPITMLGKLGLATLVAPRTSGWSGAREAIAEYVHEREHERRRALGLADLIDGAKS